MNINDKIKLTLLGAATSIFDNLKQSGLEAICDVQVSDRSALLVIRIEDPGSDLNTSWMRTNTNNELFGDDSTIAFLQDIVTDLE